MPPAVRMGLDMAGVGPLLMPPQATVFVGGSLWAVLGTPAVPHPPGGPHLVPVMIKGSMTVFVGGMPACRTGDVASCGCAALPGTPTVEVGG